MKGEKDTSSNTSGTTNERTMSFTASLQTSALSDQFVLLLGHVRWSECDSRLKSCFTESAAHAAILRPALRNVSRLHRHVRHVLMLKFCDVRKRLEGHNDSQAATSMATT